MKANNESLTTTKSAEFKKNNDATISNSERELSQNMVLREKEFSSIMVRASATIAEYRAKSKLIVAFQKGMASYAEKLARYNTEISNLESRIVHLQKEIEPIDEKVNKLKDDINKHIFLYKDKSSSINNMFIEIENILFEYSRKIKSDEFKNIISDKKAFLRRMCEEIENLEIRITSMELERLGRQNDIQPRVDEIKNLNLQLKYLKNESTQTELLGLFSITGNAVNIYEDTNEKKSKTRPSEVYDLNSHLIQDKEDSNR